jgi:UPF0271 protein
MSRSVDLNADMGEYADAAQRAVEAALMPLVTSCSIACGGHAGNAETMGATARLARDHGVSAGAHPSYPDRAGFGRGPITIGPEDLAQSLARQLAALRALLEAEGIPLGHVKPHGALYADAARSPALAELVVGAAATAVSGRRVLVVGPPGSALERAARAGGLPFAAEGFVDRRYLADGSLAPRGAPGVIIEDLAARAAQALALARGGVVATLCVHSDAPGAVETAEAVRAALEGAGIPIGRLA